MLDHPLFNFCLSTLPRVGFFAVLVIAILFLDSAASAQTPPSISGTITLQGDAANNRNQPLTFTFQPGAGSAVTTIQLGGGDVAYWFPSGTGGTGLTRTVTPNTERRDVPLIAISNLTAASGNGQVSLTWSAVSRATGYTVYQSDTSDGPYLKMNAVPVTGTSYVDGDLANGKRFYYYVTALNTVGESYQSNQADAVPQVPASAQTRTQEEIIQTARTFCQAIGVSLNGMTVTAAFPSDNHFSKTGPQEARWTIRFEKVIAHDSTGRERVQAETVEIVDATGMISEYQSDISGGVDDYSQPQGPAIDQAQAIQYALTALQATGEPEELVTIPEAQEVKRNDDFIGHIWQITWQRQYQGVPYTMDGVYVELQAETGRVLYLNSLNGDYTLPPSPSVVANLISQAQAENIAQGQINTAGIQNATLGSSKLELISSINTYWQNGNTDEVSCPLKAAWHVTFWINDSTSGFDRDVYLDAQTGDVIAGYAGNGWNSMKIRPTSQPKAVVRQNKKAVISKKSAVRKATASPKASKQKKAASHAPPPRHSHKPPHKHSA